MTHSPAVTATQEWLMRHKADTGASWQILAERSGIAQGTLSQFGPGSYKGDMEEVARKVERYRATAEAQAELMTVAPIVPGYVETKTAMQVKRLLTWAHSGAVVAITGGPGIGKTTVTKHYAKSAANVWRLEVTESCASLGAMLVELLAVMGDPDATGTPQRLARRIRDKVEDKRGLIILDEAQKLSEKAVEEARSLNDLTGVGLALVGTVDVISRLEGGAARKATHAQLYSRLDMRMIRPASLVEDAAAIADAWGVTGAKEVDFLTGIAVKPGGLRSVTKVMKLASMLAMDEGMPVLSHMRDAWAQLSTRPVAA